MAEIFTQSNTTQFKRLVANHYAVRVGIHGQVGRFSHGGEIFQRGVSVVCRTARGLEVGSVLNPIHYGSRSTKAADGTLIRRMTAEDHLLWNNLKQLAQASYAACQSWIDESESKDQLLEVEPLFDGRTLYFHFLSDVSSQTSSQIEQLVIIFQQTVAESSFSQLLEKGCGPGCGTSAATNGCGGACHTCVVSSGCGSERRAPRRNVDRGRSLG